MTRNQKLIKSFRIIAIGLMSIVLFTIITNALNPNLEFPNVQFNRQWRFLMCYFSLISFVLFLFIYHSIRRVVRGIILGLGILIAIIAILNIMVMTAKIEYEPHFDRFIIYKNLDKRNQYVVIQDFTEWKPNLPAIDTVLINDYFFLRERIHIDSLTIKGNWIKFDENNNVIDTITIK